MPAVEEPVQRDRYSLNVVAEAFSRILSFGAGILSSVILYRSMPTDDYATIKVLTSTINIVLPLVLLGLSGAVVRVVAEYSHDREKLGETIGSSVVLVVIAYFIGTILILISGMDQYILGEGTTIGIEEQSLRIYWILIIVTILPTAFLRISRAAFSGFQQMKRNLVVDIIYNSIRISVLIWLFFQNLVLVFNILVLNLAIAIIAAIAALYILIKIMRENEIPWVIIPSKEVKKKIMGLAGVALIGTLVIANINSVTILWVNGFGTAQDVALFAIAQNMVLTAREILSAPLVALGPNLAYEAGRGRMDQLARKFEEGYRILIPMYAFAFAFLFAFATPILRVLYGAEAVGAVPYMQLLSFNVIFVVIPGFYTYIFTAIDDIRALLWNSILQVSLQTAWFAITALIIGVVGIASVWVVYIPFYLVVHAYCKRKYNIYIKTKKLIPGILNGFLFAIGMYWLTNILLVYMPGFLGFFSALLGGITIPYIIGYGLIGLIIIPMWFLYILSLIILRIVNHQDLTNLVSVIRIVPPLWWITRPLMDRILHFAEKRSNPVKEEISVDG